jgi:hypothetical protein
MRSPKRKSGIENKKSIRTNTLIKSLIDKDLVLPKPINTEPLNNISLSNLIDLENSDIIKSVLMRKNKFIYSSSSIDEQLKLEEDIHELRKEMRNLYTRFNQEKSDKNSIIEELNRLKYELHSKENISHILPKICETAKQKLLSDDTFKKLFQDATNCECVVVSIDIRRSTELMLKARKPELFSKFITELSQKLSDTIINNFGVFDKFTGDGILAFFPKFYSGEEAIIRSLKAAEECHNIFTEHYRNSRECF